MDRRDRARAYYDAIDDGAYERLRGLLAADFRQERGDMTLDGPDEFVAFMQEDRPETDTTHRIKTVYEADAGVAVEGELHRADGELWFKFVDTFRIEDDGISRLETYTQSP